MTNARTGPNATAWLLLSAAIIGLDQWSKAWVLSSLPEYTAVPVIDGFWNWYRSYNTGAAFSFLAEHPQWSRWLFSFIAIGVSAVLVRWLAQTPRRDWRTALPLALVIGGALGNLIDRLRVGQVTDFIQVYIGVWPFPAFNVADSAISVGAVLLVIFGLFAHGKSTK